MHFHLIVVLIVLKRVWKIMEIAPADRIARKKNLISLY